MGILHNIHQFKVYSPALKNYKHKFAIPDGIIHDFTKRPLNIKGKCVYLEEG